MLVGVGLAVLLLAGVSVALAWRQYDDAKSKAVTDLRARAVAVSAVLDSAVAGDVFALETGARAPVIVSGKPAAIAPYLARAFPSTSPFTGGVGWIDRRGRLRASIESSSVPGLDLSRRAYVRRALATGKPYVSAGLIGIQHGHEILVIAVPTYDSRGRIAGVLAGSVRLKPPRESTEALDLGFGNLEVIDRDGRMLVSGLARVPNLPLLATMRRERTGALTSTPGLRGGVNDVVAFATVPLARWLIVFDRPESTLFAAARHSFMLELASVAASALLILALVAFTLRLSRRDAARQAGRAHAWSNVTRALGSASTPQEVARALLSSLADMFPEGVAVVAIATTEDAEVRGASRLSGVGRIVNDREVLDAVALRSVEGPGTWKLEGDKALALVHAAAGRRFASLHGLPVVGRRDERLGMIAVLTGSAFLESSDWALLESTAEQASRALSRAWRFAQEHELAVQLQRSLLPGGLPTIDGIDLDAHYLAGVATVEVGGDWYDAVRRPDGILQLCVGDVSGRGISAATVMGTQRSTFRAYAFECESPAEIIRRMLRHIDGDSQMITVACVSVDPYTGELAYARAGHPPPLLLDRATGKVTRLDGGGSPPLGVADPSDVAEATMKLEGSVTLAMYTDGLLERRGESIDDAISTFSDVLAHAADLAPAELVDEIGMLLGAPDDDVALLVVSIDLDRATFEVEMPAEPSSLAPIRRRLRAWLARRGLEHDAASEIVLATSEACNNAVEHAYRGSHGVLIVTAHEQQGRLEVVVEDRGDWRDQPASDERGRGILLIRGLMDSADFHRSPQGTRVVLRRRLRDARRELPPARVATRTAD